jgi:hypothetical protein
MIARDAGVTIMLAALLPFLWFEFVAWRDLPEAPQTQYQAGVPHTAANGTRRTAFDPGQSFLPIGIYHALTGSWHGRDYDLADLKAAGFNVAHFWERQSLTEIVASARLAGLQAIFHEPGIADARRFRDDPTLLSWYLDEEPTLRYAAERQDRRRAAFIDRRDGLRRVDPGRPVHIIDSPPGDFAVWDAWSKIGDVASFSVYPVVQTGGIRLAGTRRLADTVTRAVTLNGESKPLWFVAQAFASPRFGWRLPSGREYRAMVYTALVHGATGIIAFAYDSFVTRDGQVLGIAPGPSADYGDVPDYDGRGDTPLAVGAQDLAASRELWRDVSVVNRELAALTPALLSPTAAVPYRVEVRGLSEVATPIRALLKRDSESYVLIAVNLADRALRTRFAFDARVAELRRPFAPGARVVAGEFRWEDRLEPLAVRVYRFDLSVQGLAGGGT